MFLKRKTKNAVEFKNIRIYIRLDNQKSIEATRSMRIIPRKGEILQYNGVQYHINDIIHHYKEGFAPYIDLVCEEYNV